jgi:predicted MFS family arabinose efflux permease
MARPVSAEPTPSRGRVATAVIFFVAGGTWGEWVTRVPGIQYQVHTRSGPLGVALLCLAVGAVAARPCCSRLVQRYGSGRVTRIAMVYCCLSLILPALSGSVWTLGLALVVFGSALGAVDVAMNAHAVAIARRSGGAVMSLFHGLYSAGGLVGALAGGRAAAAGLSPLRHFVLAAAVLSALALIASRHLLPSSIDKVSPEMRSSGLHRLSRGCVLPLILLGVIALCALAAEGAVGDWGAIYLHDNLKTSASVASCGFAAFSLAMVTGRLLGNSCLRRWGDWRVVTCTATFGGAGFALALVAGRSAAAIAGFVVLGLGLSVVLPVTVSQAGRAGGAAAARAVALVSSLSQLGPVVIPPVIGFLAEPLGLPAAFGTVSVLAFTAVALVPGVKRLTKLVEAPAVARPSASLSR